MYSCAWGCTTWSRTIILLLKKSLAVPRALLPKALQIPRVNFNHSRKRQLLCQVAEAHAYCSGVILPPLRHLASLKSFASLGFSPFLCNYRLLSSSASKLADCEFACKSSCPLSLLCHNDRLLSTKQSCCLALASPSAPISKSELVVPTEPLRAPRYANLMRVHYEQVRADGVFASFSPKETFVLAQS